jgi:hypothetical protein
MYASMMHPNGGPLYCADVTKIIKEVLRDAHRVARKSSN